MKRMKAQLYKLPNSIGVPTLKIKCEQTGDIQPVECCRVRYCKASLGYKEYREDGKMAAEVMCGLEEWRANGS